MTDNKAQMASPAFRIAALDQDFVLGDTTRGVRFQLEYQKAEEYLRKWGVASTVVVFGSAPGRKRRSSRRFWHLFLLPGLGQAQPAPARSAVPVSPPEAVQTLAQSH